MSIRLQGLSLPSVQAGRLKPPERSVLSPSGGEEGAWGHGCAIKSNVQGVLPLVVPEIAVLFSFRIGARLEVIALYILHAARHFGGRSYHCHTGLPELHRKCLGDTCMQ